jgi:hypothetical protein
VRRWNARSLKAAPPLNVTPIQEAKEGQRQGLPAHFSHTERTSKKNLEGPRDRVMIPICAIFRGFGGAPDARVPHDWPTEPLGSPTS